jgi:hypothetical protein
MFGDDKAPDTDKLELDEVVIELELYGFGVTLSDLNSTKLYTNNRLLI